MKRVIACIALIGAVLFFFGCPPASQTEPEELTVTYDPNGADSGTAPVDGNSYFEGDTITVLGNSGGLAKTDYSFSGWNTASDGTGTVYNEGDSIIIGTESITFYAMWNEIITYSVTYMPNEADAGSAPVDSNVYQENETITVLGNTGNLTKISHFFSGWNLAEDGKGTNYIEDSTFTMGSSNVILFANWTLNPTYNVTYLQNGASGSVPTDGNAYEEEDLVTVLGNPGPLTKSEDGITLVFVGWNTESDGQGTGYTEGESFSMGTADVDLYSEWTAIGGIGPAGGWVFFDDEDDGVDDFPAWRYIEAAPSDQSAGIIWGQSSHNVSGAEGSAIGTGEQNTVDIMADPGTEPNFAAKLCDELDVDGITGWFLPSKDEMNLMDTILHDHDPSLGGFTTTKGYWSSTESPTQPMFSAWVENFDGSSNYYNKATYSNPVRAARYF